MASVPGTKYDQEPFFTNVTVHRRVSIVIYYTCIYVPYSCLYFYHFYQLQPLPFKIP